MYCSLVSSTMLMGKKKQKWLNKKEDDQLTISWQVLICWLYILQLGDIIQPCLSSAVKLPLFLFNIFYSLRNVENWEDIQTMDNFQTSTKYLIVNSAIVEETFQVMVIWPLVFSLILFECSIMPILNCRQL